MGPPEMRLTPSPWTKDLHHSGWIGRPSRAFPPVNPYVMVSHHTAFIILHEPHEAPRGRRRGTALGPTPSEDAPRLRLGPCGLDAPNAGLPGDDAALTRQGALRRGKGALEDGRTAFGRTPPRPCGPGGALFKDLRHGQVGLLSERSMGSYPRDYGGAFAFCRILYPPVCGTGCPGPSPLSPRLPRPRPGREGTEGQPTGLPSSGWDT